MSYTSTIALPLAATLSVSPEWVAKALVVELSTTTGQTLEDNSLSSHWETMHELWKHSNISATSEGWLQWRLDPQGLALWLQTLIERQLSSSDGFQAIDELGNDSQFLIETSINFFGVYHAYARCYSLLHQAQQTDLISFTSAEFAVAEATFSPSYFPWLNANGHPYFTHWTEYELIRQLAIGLDELAHAYAINHLENLRLAKAAVALSQSFQRFHADCRIWETQAPSRILAQARLGLVLATMYVLRLLVQDGLGILLVKAL